MENKMIISDIDALLSTDKVFYEDFDTLRKKCMHFTTQALKTHMENNQYYKEYCEKLNFTVEDALTDISKVPLIPSAIFKKDVKFVHSNDKPYKKTTSSGTKGTVSIVPRDNDTLMRFFASITAGMQDILENEQSELNVFSLSPSEEEVEHLWISYVLAGIAVYFPCNYYVSNDTFDIEKLVCDLKEVDISKNVQNLIVGPPALFMDVTKYLEKNGNLQLNRNTKIITIGGWKARQGESIARKEFDGRVTKAFGLFDESYVRDVYNMVEMNTVIFECNVHRKHCPPWLIVRAFHPRTLEVLSSGEEGILGFIDPTPFSYPGFILSDDFGCVFEKVKCSCGVESDILEVTRRINKLESRGCALKI